MILGNFSEEVTLLGTVGQVGLGLIGVDLPCDVRDIIADFANWEWSWGHFGNLVMDVVCVLPVIGALKYGDEIGTVLKRFPQGFEKAAVTIAAGWNKGAKYLDEMVQTGQAFLKRVVKV